MESTSKKSKASRRNDARDRLSELPDEILVHILSFLPILDAVRTILIRRFGNLWTLVSSLKIEDFGFFKPRKCPPSTIDSDDETYCENEIPCFGRFVRSVLMLHKGFPVNKFRLRLGLTDHVIDAYVWIRFAIERQVKELQVQLDDVDRCYRLPCCIFTSQFLVKLELSKCEIEGLSRVQMGSLRKLSLDDVRVSNEMLKKVIDGCPCLQELALRYVNDLDEVRFNAPNIVKLDLYSCNIRVLDIRHCSVESSHLQVVNISYVREVHITSINQIDKMLIKICKAEVVKFSQEAFSELNFKELNIPQTRWKCLHISSSRLNEDQLIGICRLLRSSPHLKELIVHSMNNTRQDLGETHDYHMLSEELSSPLVIPVLKTVTLHFYEVPCQGLLQLLAEYLLKSCVNLEKMVILPRSSFDLVEEHKFLKQLCNFPRASANARVMYYSK